MRLIFFVSLLVFSILCCADVYLQTDKNGNQIYSDTPTEGAQKIDTSSSGTATLNKPASTTTPEIPSVSAATTHPAEQTPAKATYTQFTIASPVDQQTFNSNDRFIPVMLSITPDLQNGDQTQLYLDGQAFGTPSASPHPMLSNVERGTHTLYAVIIDANNKIVKQSQTITIYLHYVHV